MLTTLARVKNFLKIENDSKDSLLDELISGVSALLETEMQRSILSSQTKGEQQIVMSSAEVNLPLEHGPIISVESVTESGDLVASNGYKINGYMLQRMSGIDLDGWTPGIVLVDYTHGFDQVPEDIALAATSEVALAYQQSNEGGGRLGLAANEVESQASATFTAWRWQPLTLRTILNYRRIRTI